MDDRITNGDFETGDLTGWSVYPNWDDPTYPGTATIETNSTYVHSGTYGCLIDTNIVDGWASAAIQIAQYHIKLIGDETISFYYKIPYHSGDICTIWVSLDGTDSGFKTILYKPIFAVDNNWTQASYDCTGITGTDCEIRFALFINDPGYRTKIAVDDIQILTHDIDMVSTVTSTSSISSPTLYYIHIPIDSITSSISSSVSHLILDIPLITSITPSSSVSSSYLTGGTSIINGDFETGDLTGWTVYTGDSGDVSVTTDAAITGTYGCEINVEYMYYDEGLGEIQQDIDVTEYLILKISYIIPEYDLGYGDVLKLSIRLDKIGDYNTIHYSSYENPMELPPSGTQLVTYDVTELTGIYTFKIQMYIISSGGGIS
ncbi:MAG: hypothetical protein M0R51_15985 [Clostridia bacterium]|jgi:hypothetical protein|nr:hypothetical protein [Clostridia bacterium]